MTTLAQATHRLLSQPLLLDRSWAMQAMAAMRSGNAELTAAEIVEEPANKPQAFFGLFGEDEDAESVPTRQVRGLSVIRVSGVMVDEADWIDRLFFGAIEYGEIAEAIRLAAADDSTEAIVLDLNTPGGTCTGISDALGAIDAARSVKPVVAFAHDMATSGGQYLAAHCDDTLATPSALVGSIGGISFWWDSSELYAKHGLRAVPITTGRHKAAGADGVAIDDDMTDHQRQRLQVFVDRFADAVARQAGRSRQDILGLEAAVFFGEEGQVHGLCGVAESFEAGLKQIEQAVQGRRQTPQAAAATTASTTFAKGSSMSNTITDRRLRVRAQTEEEDPKAATDEEQVMEEEDQEEQAGYPDYESMDEEEQEEHMKRLKAAMGEDEDKAESDEDEPAAEDPKMPGDEDDSAKACASIAQLTELVSGDDGVLSSEAKAFIFDAQQSKLTIAQAANQWVKANASIAQQAVQQAGLVDRSKPLATEPVSARGPDGGEGGYRDINEAANAISKAEGIDRSQAYAKACKLYPKLAREGGHPV